MVEIIRLHSDPHRQTQQLLPWYVNGTLDTEDRQVVEAHLDDCDDCRADLRLERILGHEIAALPTGGADGWAALRERAETSPRRPAAVWSSALTVFSRRISLGSALAQAACLALVIGLIAATLRPHPTARYVALGAPATQTTGNVIVMFDPATAEADLRGALAPSGARLVDGPTASGAYILHVAPAQRGAALQGLKANRHVILAEPIDGPAQP